jgi:hypothetical protein
MKTWMQMYINFIDITCAFAKKLFVMDINKNTIIGVSISEEVEKFDLHNSESD